MKLNLSTTEKRFSLIILSNFIFFNIFTTKAVANASMPAFWNLGSAQTPSIFDPKSKLASENIKMSSEKVTILLYENFSVVKGEYFMSNLSNKDINVEVGYPENEVFKNKEVDNIVTNKISNLKVFFDDKNILYKNNDSSKKWYVWNNLFKAKKDHKITVYFMTENNHGKISKGYDSTKDNGFTYILESGKVWKDKIGNGEIYIKLMNKLSLDDLIGVYPLGLYYDKDSKTILYKFNDLEPTHENNILIRYKKNNISFDFSKISTDSEKYFSEIDKFKYSDSSKFLDKIEKNDFSIPTTSTFGFYLLILGIIFALIIVISILIVLKIIKSLINKIKK